MPIWIRIVATLALGATIGCSSYSQKALRVREPIVRRDFSAALEFLEKEKPGGDGLPYLMELGLVLRYDGRIRESNEAFEAAELLAEDLYTRSISRELLSFATNDEVIPYVGEAWEHVFINYYRALNYVDLGDFDGALVECRKLNHKLSVFAQAEDPRTYHTDAFGQYLTGILFEIAGDIDDAWVSLRQASRSYDYFQETYGVEAPRSLQRDYARIAHDIGEKDVLDSLRAETSETIPLTDELLDQGELVLFYEEGFAPAKIQTEIQVPIFKSDESDDVEYHADVLRHRVLHPPRYQKSELDYFLRVALPAHPAPDRSSPGFAVIRTGPDSTRTELASDLEAVARRGLQDRKGAILLKSIARALVKYAATKGAQERGELTERLVNLFTAAIEKADTRSWLTLPRSVQVARLVVRPGSHDVAVDCYDDQGRFLESVEFPDVRVEAGEVRILAYRTFEP